MSFHAYNAVRACSHARGSALAVLHEIADRINDDDGYCHVSIERVAQDTHMSEIQVHRAITKLIVAGDLVVVARSGRTNLYFIPLYPREPGYEAERCEETTHRCTGEHAPLTLNRRDILRGLLTGEAPARTKPAKTQGGIKNDTPLSTTDVSTMDRGVSSAIPGGIIGDTGGVSSAIPKPPENPQRTPKRTKIRRPLFF